MRTIPAWIAAILSVCLLVGLIWLAIYPLIPVRLLLEYTTGEAPLALIRGHRTTVPFHLAWSSEGWRWGAWPLRCAPALLVAACVFFGWRRRTRPVAEHTARSRWAIGALVVIGAVVAFWFGRVALPVMLTYGDTLALIPQIAAADRIFPAEPLMMHLFNGVSRFLTNVRGTADGLLAGTLTAMLCGIVYLLSLWALALERTRQRMEALLLLAAFACTGTATQFFGYIETTLLQTAGIAGFLAATAWTLRASRSTPTVALLAVHVSMGVLLCAHAAGVAMLPALLVLWGVLVQRARRQGTLRSLLGARHVAGLLLGIALPWILVVWWPFYRHGNFGNSAGGGDSFRFVPWDIDSARLSSDYVYYAMISRLHAMDLGAAMVMAAPFSIPLIACAAALRRRAATRWQHHDDGLHAVMLVSALCSASVVLVWDFDFGMWGDWNIVACYLLPLHVYAWTVFTDALRQYNDKQHWQWTLLWPLFLVQYALALGMWLQFQPPDLR